MLSKHRDAMTRGEAVPVTLVTHEEQRAEGVIRLQRLSPQERNARASKWLFICLALAPVTAVCPPHFPWPIITIAVGIVGFYLRRGRRELVLAGEGTCPKCGAFQILESGNAEFPMAHFCTECHERSLVAPIDPDDPDDPDDKDDEGTRRRDVRGTGRQERRGDSLR